MVIKEEFDFVKDVVYWKDAVDISEAKTNETFATTLTKGFFCFQDS